MTTRITHKGDVITIDFNAPKKGFATVSNHLTKKEYEMTNSSKGLKLLLKDVAEYFIEDLKEDVKESNKEESFEKPDEPPYGADFIATMECIKNYKMDSGEISFTKGKSYDFYRVHGDFWVVDDQNDGHWMEITDIVVNFVF